MRNILIIASTFLGVVNLLRIVIYIVASDVHEIKKHHDRNKLFKVRATHPWVSIIVPAYNEELSIKSTVVSVLESNYPHFEVIVVDDGSKDKTSQIVKHIIKNNPTARLKLIRQKNAGKSHALNNGISKARGSLVMCLDADSTIAKDGVANAVNHFQRNPHLAALASNMKVMGKISILNIAQRLEYLVGNRFKRSLSILNTEYIIGGIGSTFRKSYLKRVGFYDTDTMTEDIDLTMKIIRIMGNKKYKVDYGYDVHTYTQGVPNLKDLIKQRFRWKYGRMQTFYKNRIMFFNKKSKYSKLLTFFQLPHAVYGDLLLILEPIMAFYIIYNVILLGKLEIIYWGILFMSLYVSHVIITSNDDRFNLKQKISLLFIAPLSWLLFYIITFVDFCAFLSCIKKIREIPNSLKNQTAQWEHVERLIKVG